MNWATSSLVNRKEPQKSCSKRDIFTDPSEQKEASYPGHLLVDQSRLPSLHLTSLGAGQITCLEQANADW